MAQIRPRCPRVGTIMRTALALAVLACAGAARADEAALVAGNTAFAADLYRTVAGERGNLAFSPYSISTALAMTFAGARGRTAAEMASALHFDGDGAALHAGFARLARGFAPGPKPPYELSIANRLFAQEGHPFLDAFLAPMRDDHGAPVELVDFRGAA